MNNARRYTAYANTALDYLPLADAKLHLRVTASTEDSYITGLIGMAIETCSAYLGYSIRKCTARYAFDGFTGMPALINPINGLNIPSGNYLRINSRILAVNSVNYVNSSNVVTAFGGTDWIAAVEPMSSFTRNIFINAAPTSVTDDAIKYIVEVSEGFNIVGTASVDPDTICPSAIKHAALLLVAQYYDNRQSVSYGANNYKMNYGLEYLLDTYKIPVFA